MTIGRLHSIETFGAVDGPGLRTVFFMQGCPARCLYCHNPDTWDPAGGREIKPEEVLKTAKRSLNYYGEKGGVTFSGGEPLIQGEFVLETARLLAANNIKTVVDTSGTYTDKYTEDIFRECQAVLLDIKHSSPDIFKDICKCNQNRLMETIELLNRSGAPIWIRQVIVPGINDSMSNIDELAAFIKKHIANVEKIELLGYHTMALNKYEKLKMDYSLAGTSPMDKDRLAELQSHINNQF